MRPGPGLVVMALAFISGARRGSTSQQKQHQHQDTEQQQHHQQQLYLQQHHDQHQQQQQQQLSLYPNIYDNFRANFVIDKSYDNNYNNIDERNYVNSNGGYVTDNDNFVSYNQLAKIGYDSPSEEEEDSYGVSGGKSALARVNPWLSACDLAQPNQAPDLQGQCSAGSLPVAWVDEGPGPPRCPQSCEQLRLQEELLLKNNKNRLNDNNNMNKFLSNSHNNKNINNNFNTMDYNKDKNQLPHQQTMTTDQQIQKQLIQQYEPQKQQQQQYHQQQQQQQQKQQKHQQQQQSQQQQQHQCLDYLGDTDESSPAQLCKKSRNVLAQKLRVLRMKHCCERTVFSALHTLALNATLNGGSECIRTLNDLLDMDALATRITCEFNEILVRYDCRQTYSLIHHCEDCREAYRRWVCSTLIPYYAEPEDIRQKTTTSNTINKTENHSAASSNLYHARTSRSTREISDKHDNDYANDNNNDNSKKILNTTTTNSTSTTSNNNSKNVQRRRTNSGTLSNIVSQSISTAIANPNVQDPLLDRLLKRTKRKSQVKRRRRLRPCLSVCQTVEQICPYLLPADRAPAYPTQYAGEPTFLCLDPNIQETGEQLRKSNNGPANCCYRYCGTAADGICAHCDLFYSNQSNRTVNDTSTSSSSHHHTQHHHTSSSSISSSDSSSSTMFTQQHHQQQPQEHHRSNLDLSRMIEIDNIYYYDDYDDTTPPKEPIANCQHVQSTTPISSHPCTIPYYASSSSSIHLGSTLMSYRFFIFWTIFWCLLVNITIPVNSYFNWFIINSRRFTNNNCNCNKNYKKQMILLLYQQQRMQYVEKHELLYLQQKIHEQLHQIVKFNNIRQHKHATSTTTRVNHIVMRL